MRIKFVEPRRSEKRSQKKLKTNQTLVYLTTIDIFILLMPFLDLRSFVSLLQIKTFRTLCCSEDFHRDLTLREFHFNNSNSLLACVSATVEQYEQAFKNKLFHIGGNLRAMKIRKLLTLTRNIHDEKANKEKANSQLNAGNVPKFDASINDKVLLLIHTVLNVNKNSNLVKILLSVLFEKKFFNFILLAHDETRSKTVVNFIENLVATRLRPLRDKKLYSTLLEIFQKYLTYENFHEQEVQDLFKNFSFDNLTSLNSFQRQITSLNLQLINDEVSDMEVQLQRSQRMR